MKSATQQWYEDHLLGPVNQQNAAVREQIAVAMDSVPSVAGDVDAWFEKNFKAPPVSHDVELYNALHKAKEALKVALSPHVPPSAQADQDIT